MASSITINGQTTSLPGAYADPKFSAVSRALPRAKVVAILGEFPELENGVLGRFSSAGDMVAAAPTNTTLELAAAIAFAPGNDAAVGSPAAILVASTLASVAAKAQLSDAYGDLGVTLSSKLFGPTGNQIAFTFVANATDSLKRDLVVYKSGSPDALSSLGSGPVIEVGYAGTFADHMGLSATGPIYDEDLGEVTSEVRVDLSKVLDATGATYAVPSADQVASSVLTFSAEAGTTIAAETAVTITGAAANGAPTTEVVTLPIAFNTSISSTTVWSRVDSIDVAAEAGAAGNLNVCWQVVKVDKHTARTLAQVAGILGDLANVTAAIKNARASTLTLGDLDFLPSADFKTTAKALRADGAELVRQINARSRFAAATRELPVAAWTLTRVATTGTGTCVAGATAMTMSDTTGLSAGSIIFVGPTAGSVRAVFRVASVDSGTDLTLEAAAPFACKDLPVFVLGNPPAGRVAGFAGSRVLAGGTTGTSTTDSINAARSALAFSDASIICVLSLSATLIRAAYDHAVLMSGVGANECFVWAALPAGSTKAEIDTATLGYNDRLIGFAAQSIRVIDSRGNRRLLDPRFQALQLAAGMGGVGIAEPLTAKYMNVVGVVDGPDWDATANPSELIQLGLTCYRRDTRGYQVARAVTSYRASDDVNQSEVSAVESSLWQVKDMREELLSIIGSNSSETLPEALAGNIIARGRVQAEGKLIRKLHEDTVQIIQNGDTGVASYDFEPSVPYNFLILQPTIRQVSFQFNVT